MVNSILSFRICPTAIMFIFTVVCTLTWIYPLPQVAHAPNVSHRWSTTGWWKVDCAKPLPGVIRVLFPLMECWSKATTTSWSASYSSPNKLAHNQVEYSADPSQNDGESTIRVDHNQASTWLTLFSENDDNSDDSTDNFQPNRTYLRRHHGFGMKDTDDVVSNQVRTETSRKTIIHRRASEEQAKTNVRRIDIIGFLLAAVGLMLAAGGGVGGGGILVPIFCLVMGFPTKQAIPLSNITILGGALANAFLNWPKRHPQADRPLIDWDLMLIMVPLTLAGTLIGAIFNKLLPDLLLAILLAAALCAIAFKTISTAITLYNKESHSLVVKSGSVHLAGNNQDATESTPLVDNINTFEKRNTQLSDTLQMILRKERAPSWESIFILGVTFAVVLIANILKGGGAFQSPLRIGCGSPAFWGANCAILVWILSVALYSRALLLRKHQEKVQCGYPFSDIDMKWDSRTTIVYPTICGCAGLFAGLFGIGGGIVMGPLMLAMGVHPAVSSASSAFIILFTSFTATTSFWVFGLLRLDYALPCFILGVTVTTFGQIVLHMIINRTGGRNSYIAFAIGAVVMISAVLMTTKSILNLASGEHHHNGDFCGSPE